MATLENFIPGPALDFSSITNAIDKNRNLDFAREKLRIDEEIRRGTLSVAQGSLALKELEAQTAATRAEKLGGLQDQFSNIFRGDDTGGLPQQAPQGGLDELITSQLGGVSQGQDIVPSAPQVTTPAPAQRRQARVLTADQINGLTKVANRMNMVEKGSGTALLDNVKFANDQQLEILERERKKRRGRAFQIRDQPFDRQTRILQQIRARDIADGLDVSEIDKMLGMDFDARNVAIDIDLFMDKNIDEFLKIAAKPTETFETILDAKGNIIAQRNIVTGEEKKSPRAVGAKGGGIIPSTQISEGGFIVMQNSDGTTTAIRVLSKEQLANEVKPFSAQRLAQEKELLSTKATTAFNNKIAIESEKIRLAEQSPSGQRTKKLSELKIREAENKQILDVAKRQMALDARQVQIDVINGRVDKALDLVDGWFASGILAPTMNFAFPSNAREMESLITTIKANLSFETLSAMKAASETGGALGAINTEELRLLGATIANLDIGLPDTVLEANLTFIKTTLKTWKTRLDKERATLRTLNQPGGNAPGVAPTSDTQDSPFTIKRIR